MRPVRVLLEIQIGSLLFRRPQLILHIHNRHACVGLQVVDHLFHAAFGTGRVDSGRIEFTVHAVLRRSHQQEIRTAQRLQPVCTRDDVFPDDLPFILGKQIRILKTPNAISFVVEEPSLSATEHIVVANQPVQRPIQPGLSCQKKIPPAKPVIEPVFHVPAQLRVQAMPMGRIGPG